MAYTDIDKPDEYFNTKLYTGTGSSLGVTGVGFQPDFVWFKNRGTTNSHGLQDVVRGFNTTGIQSTNGTDADPSFNGSTLGYVSAVSSDGFTVEAGNCANASSNNYVSWNWLAGGTASSNTDGSITSNVSANTTSGFSIVSYTGNSTSGATVGHGLGSVPNWIIVKDRDNTRSWTVYHQSIGNTHGIYLNATSAKDDDSVYWNDTTPSSSIFTLGSSNETNASASMIAYCFADVQGYSKFGSYTGNGNADGTFVYTGFKPAFVIIKSTGVNNWGMYDNKRNSFNLVNNKLLPNTSDAENIGTANELDFTSNGFKCRATNAATNASGDTYIYMAFAENPFVSSTGVPATAR